MSKGNPQQRLEDSVARLELLSEKLLERTEVADGDYVSVHDLSKLASGLSAVEKLIQEGTKQLKSWETEQTKDDAPTVAQLPLIPFSKSD